MYEHVRHLGKFIALRLKRKMSFLFVGYVMRLHKKGCVSTG